MLGRFIAKFDLESRQRNKNSILGGSDYRVLGCGKLSQHRFVQSRNGENISVRFFVNSNNAWDMERISYEFPLNIAHNIYSIIEEFL